jgi:hypothetical protein
MPATAASAPWLDRSAVALSGLCLVHCALAATLIVAATPLAWLGAHWIHAWGLALVAPLSLLALWRGRRRHGEPWPMAAGLAGLALMAAGQAAVHGHLLEFALTGLGAAVHAAAHALNIRALARTTASARR